MRILQVIPSYLPAIRYGGPIFATHALAKALVQRGHEIEVYTTNATGEKRSTPAGTREIDGVTVRYFAADWLRRLSWAPSLGRALAREIDGFDIAHLQTVFLWPTWKAARIAPAHRVPYVLSPRGMLVKDLIRRRSRMVKSAWIGLIEKRNLENAAAIHVTSQREADDLRAFGWTLPPMTAIPNGVELDEPAGAVSPDVAEIARNQPYVLFLGRLTWKKGLDVLLQAFARTRHGFLVIAGTDDEGLSHSLRQLSGDLGIAGRVHLLPRTVSAADKHRLYQEARVFTLPSYSENFGNTVLEAMHAGLPVVLTPEVGAAEVVMAARAGMVVGQDAAALGTALERFIVDESLARQMGEAGRHYVRRNCGWPIVAAAMERLYEKVLSERRQNAAAPSLTARSASGDGCTRCFRPSLPSS